MSMQSDLACLKLQGAAPRSASQLREASRSAHAHLVASSMLGPRRLPLRCSLCDRSCTPGRARLPSNRSTVCLFVAALIACWRATQAMHTDVRSRSGETGVSSSMLSAAHGSRSGPVSPRHRMAPSCQTFDINAPPALSIVHAPTGGPADSLRFFCSGSGGCWLAVFACVLYDGACTRHRMM